MFGIYIGIEQAHGYGFDISVADAFDNDFQPFVVYGHQDFTIRSYAFLDFEPEITRNKRWWTLVVPVEDDIICIQSQLPYFNYIPVTFGNNDSRRVVISFKHGIGRDCRSMHNAGYAVQVDIKLLQPDHKSPGRIVRRGGGLGYL